MCLFWNYFHPCQRMHVHPKQHAPNHLVFMFVVTTPTEYIKNKIACDLLF